MPPRDDTEDAVRSPMTEPATGAIAQSVAGPGRVSTYAIVGAAVGSVPVPWVPDALTRRVRGALVTDLAARHGLSLAPEAREALAEAAGSEGPRRKVGAQAMRFFVRRVLGRFGPLAVVPTVRSAIETYVLGHLFARYLAKRRERAVRVDADEARMVRRAIDKAVGLALSPEMRSHIESAPRPPEELRDGVTQFVDGVLSTFASAPEWVLHRLEAAFDEALANP